jgi:hypothetical protein
MKMKKKLILETKKSYENLYLSKNENEKENNSKDQNFLLVKIKLE